ncbi:MAG TPA: hypothetical protein VE646_00540 [Actinomycetota bacterium]|jgi:hypothetical protein|nr:hypothetical protein [Actinomycetota bacterium]
MRWRDEYLGYLAVIVGFGAVVLWAEEVNPSVVAALAVAAALLFLVMLANIARTGEVLLVGDRRDAPVQLMEEILDEAGYEVRRCQGPDVRSCPVDVGDPCPVHCRALAAVVVGWSGGAGVRAPCGRALHVPALVVEEDTAAEPQITTVIDEGWERRGYVGWERGPEAVVGTLDRILTA